MTFPSVSRVVGVDIALDGIWTEITGHVHQTSGVTITRGHTESSQVAVSTGELTLDNSTGVYSPRNPMGAHYGLLGRNTPARVWVRTARDTYSRTVGSGWGSADTGQAWTQSGPGTTAVGSGVGTHSLPAAGDTQLSYLATVTHRPVEVRRTVTLPFTDVTGGPVYLGVLLRGQSTTRYYLAVARINTNESVSVYGVHVDGATTTAITPVVTVTGLTHTTSQALTVCGQIEGQTLRVKAWATAAGEPYAWQATGTDTADLTSARGWVGVYSRTDATNTNTHPVVISTDTVDVRVPQMAAEIPAWPTRWPIVGKVAYASVAMAGILRRLRQGDPPAHSALRTAIPALVPPPRHYWPLEEGRLGSAGHPVIGPAGMQLVTSTDSANRHWQQGRLAEWTPNGVALYGPGDHLTADITIADVDHWGVLIYFTGDQNSFWSLTLTTSAGDWALTVDPTASSGGVTGRLRVTPPGAGASDLYWGEIPSGDLKALTLEVLPQVGTPANTAWFVNLYGTVSGRNTVSFVSGTLAATPVVPPSRIKIAGTGTGTYPTAIGHAAVFDDTPGVAAALDGRRGEAAGRRIERLCALNGIPFSHVGDLDQTAAMGPQRALPLLELLAECAQADLGILYEPRGELGICYRTHRSLYGQPARLELSYDGDLVPPFEPVDDDHLTANDVTVRRVSGGEYRVTQDSGPLNVNEPWQDPQGVGRYSTPAPTVNVGSDAQLPDIASWLVHLGTVDEYRFPHIRTDGAAGDQIMDLDPGDRVTVDDTSPTGIYDQVSQLCLGYTTRLSDTVHDLDITATPASPYQVSVWDDTSARWDSDATTLTSDITSTTPASFQVTIAAGDPLWTTDAAQFPLNVRIGAEVKTISAISGTSSPQTMTVSASGVNGVAATHLAGTTVSLANPSYWGL